MALRPAEYDFGAEAPDGSAWEIFGEEYKTNPKLLLNEEDFAMTSVWILYRQGHLPDEGGVLQQPAVMIDALQTMEAAAATIWKQRRGRM